MKDQARSGRLHELAATILKQAAFLLSEYGRLGYDKEFGRIHMAAVTINERIADYADLTDPEAGRKFRHDIRNRLTHVIGYVELVREELEETDAHELVAHLAATRDKAKEFLGALDAMVQP